MENTEIKEDFIFNPELLLQDDEIAALAGIYKQAGFVVALKIMRTCVDWFVRQGLNADIANEKEIIAKHRQAKTAAQLYTLFLESINNAVEEYVHSRPNPKPVESGEGLDLGDISETEEEPIV